MRQVRTRRLHPFILTAIFIAFVGFAGPASAEASVPSVATPTPGPQQVAPPAAQSAANLDGSVDVGATVQMGAEVKVERFRVPSVRDADALVAQLRRTPGVIAAEPKVRVYASAVGPDPYRSQQWALERVPFSAASALVSASALAQQIVAVIDSGVNAAHEDLVGHVISVGADCLSGECVSGSAYGRTDPDGHGTFVASIIGATTGNACGIAGAATGAPILSVRALDAEGSGDNFSASAAIYYAVDHGAHVINMSFSGDPNVRSSMITVAVAYAISHDVTVVAAAGNNGDTGDATTPVYPANTPGVIAATSTDPDDSRSNFSNYGGWLDGKGLSAPGVQICGARGSGGYLAEAGTSFSSPLVAAAAALTRAAGAAPGAVYTTLFDQAEAIGVTHATLSNAPLLNPLRAVQAALGQTITGFQPDDADVTDSPGGYTLDGWGSLHAFAVGCNLPAPDARGLTTWRGWDIARGVTVISRSAGGYTLDGWGGLHKFRIGFGSTSPDVTGAPYWSGWDIARSIAVVPNATAGSRGGYTLDGWGGLHKFRIVGGSNPPAAYGAPYWLGWDIARGVALASQRDGRLRARRLGRPPRVQDGKRRPRPGPTCGPRRALLAGLGYRARGGDSARRHGRLHARRVRRTARILDWNKPWAAHGQRRALLVELANRTRRRGHAVTRRDQTAVQPPSTESTEPVT